MINNFFGFSRVSLNRRTKNFLKKGETEVVDWNRVTIPSDKPNTRYNVSSIFQDRRDCFMMRKREQIRKEFIFDETIVGVDGGLGFPCVSRGCVLIDWRARKRKSISECDT